MTPHRDIAGVEVWTLSRANGALAIEIAPTPVAPPPPSARVMERWAELCRANPKLYDGPILSVLHFDPLSNTVLTRRERFSLLAVQPEVPTGVKLLGQTAVLTAADAVDRRYVLLGWRSRKTRVYGGMWELGPSGGLEPPPEAVRGLNARQALAGLADEVREEVGLAIDHAAVAAYVRDSLAHSDDLVFTCDLGRLDAATEALSPANWEYAEVLWLPIDSVTPFDDANAAAIIPTTRALFRAFGWVAAS